MTQDENDRDGDLRPITMISFIDPPGPADLRIMASLLGCYAAGQISDSRAAFASVLPAPWSVAQDRQVEPAKALRVGDHVDFDDPPGRDREGEYQE
jgi:hypothetical protein